MEFTRKPFKPIDELDRPDDKDIVNPEAMRRAIDKHITEILYGPQENIEENHFLRHINMESTINDIITDNGDVQILESNNKRTQPRLWYFLTRWNPDYKKFLIPPSRSRK